MRAFCEALDTGGGHILVALFLVVLGVALLYTGRDYGKEVAAGALGSLWTAIRISNKPTAQPESPARASAHDDNALMN